MERRRPNEAGLWGGRRRPLDKRPCFCLNRDTSSCDQALVRLLGCAARWVCAHRRPAAECAVLVPAHRPQNPRPSPRPALPFQGQVTKLLPRGTSRERRRGRRTRFLPSRPPRVTESVGGAAAATGSTPPSAFGGSCLCRASSSRPWRTGTFWAPSILRADSSAFVRSVFLGRVLSRIPCSDTESA